MFHVVRYFAKVSELSSPNPASFNYDKQGKDWQVEPGKQQSPIPLVQSEALRHEARQLVFFNYTKPLYKPYLTHNGHTVRMNISETVEKQNPALAGSNLKTVYLAQQLHFHWGSERSQGSEHTIDSQRYDGELHIVHRTSPTRAIRRQYIIQMVSWYWLSCCGARRFPKWSRQP
ncbi:GL13560 [Drosophila persimilis]|uniref:Carbonic anhydrase n=1 Tax=Drosophila persimilis TaxID=7234 RepID=B4GN31_DROPE|nr:GL13560 [Drosophila persimilis]